MSFLNPIFEAIGWLLAIFYSVIPNMGVAIILLTCTIMLALYPLTAKQAKSMMAMQRVQPEIKKLQAKHKGDREKLNQEMMAFYKENKINPLAGCLPLLVQLPIFFALFTVLRDSYKYIPKDSNLYQALCDGAKCAKGAVNPQFFLGLNLQLTAVDAHNGLLDAIPYFILVGLVILTGFVQTRQSQKRTPVANKQMATMMKVLPIFFGLISIQFPSGLVLYFFMSNLWRLGQQEVIFRRHGTAISSKGAIEAKSRPRPARELASEPPAAVNPTEIDRVGGSPKPSNKNNSQKNPQKNPQNNPQNKPGTVSEGKPRGLRGMLGLPPASSGPANTHSLPITDPTATNPAPTDPAPGPSPGPSPNQSKKKKRRR